MTGGVARLWLVSAALLRTRSAVDASPRAKAHCRAGRIVLPVAAHVTRLRNVYVAPLGPRSANARAVACAAADELASCSVHPLADGVARLRSVARTLHAVRHADAANPRLNAQRRTRRVVVEATIRPASLGRGAAALRRVRNARARAGSRAAYELAGRTGVCPVAVGVAGLWLVARALLCARCAVAARTLTKANALARRRAGPLAVRAAGLRGVSSAR